MMRVEPTTLTGLHPIDISNIQADTLDKKKPLPQIPKINTNDLQSNMPILMEDGSQQQHYDPHLTHTAYNENAYYYPQGNNYYNYYPSTQVYQPYYSPYHHQQPFQQPQYPMYNFNNGIVSPAPAIDANYNLKDTGRNSIVVNDSQWKSTNRKSIQRSDSLKIETPTAPSHFTSTLETHMEKPYEPSDEETGTQKLILKRKLSKEEVSQNNQEVHDINPHTENNVLSQSIDSSSQSSNENLYSIPTSSTSSYSDSKNDQTNISKDQDFSVENFPQYLNFTSPSPPWGPPNPKSSLESFKNDNNQHITNNISASSRSQPHTYTSQITNEISSNYTGTEPINKPVDFSIHNHGNNEYTPYNNSKYGLSIASYSLINSKSSIKLYRRMAIKTRNKETQLTYAKYLIQISKLYNKKDTPQSFTISKNTPISMKNSGTNHISSANHEKVSKETPDQIRHRLLTEAGYWIERLAKSGQPEALFIQGRWYLLGPQADDCVIYNRVQEKKAFVCFVRASKAGWVDAHYELANIWKKRGSFKKAIHYYNIGAKANHTLSIYKMAKILLRGQLKMKKDIPKGLDYLVKAANMDDSTSAEPAFILGCIYAKEFKRIGIQKYLDNSKTPIESLIEVDGITNHTLALKYLKKSAQFGYSDAIYFMGQVTEQGMLGQLCDSWKAYQYYVKAAEDNHAGAMLDLSRIYYQGISGLLASQKELAFKWCKRSAEFGFDQAEYMLGKYYEDGIGVAADFPRALEYYGKAASKGYQPAAEKLNRPLADKQCNSNVTLNTATTSSVNKAVNNGDNDCTKDQAQHLNNNNNNNNNNSTKKTTKSNQENNICTIQ